MLSSKDRRKRRLKHIFSGFLYFIAFVILIGVSTPVNISTLSCATDGDVPYFNGTDWTCMQINKTHVPYVNAFYNLTMPNKNITADYFFGKFEGTLINPITSDKVIYPYLSGATYSTLKDYTNTVGSAGKLSGGTFTDNGDGTITIGAGTGLIRATDDSLAEIKFFDWSATTLSLTDQDTNYIYVDYNSGSPLVTSSTSMPSDHNSKILLGLVYRDGTDLHEVKAGQYINNHFVNTFFKDIEINGKFQRASGLKISETGTRNFALTSGYVYAGLTKVSMPAFDSSGTDTFTYYYRDGSGGWTKVTGQTQIDNLHYDDGSGTLAELTGSGWFGNYHYGVHWVYEDIDGDVFVIYGTGDYTLAEAQAATAPSNIPNLIRDVGGIVGKIIIKKNADTFTSIESPFDTQFVGTGVVNHNDLSAIQGGTSDEYYHFTEAEHTELTDWLPHVDLASNGYIGIVKTNPAAPIHIASSTSWTTSNWNRNLILGGGHGAIQMGYGSGTRWGFGNTGGTLYFWTTDGDDTSVSPNYELMMDGTDTVLYSNLQVKGGNIKGDNGGGLNIKVDTSLSVHLDDDNNGSGYFNILNGGNANVFQVDEGGNTAIKGTVTISDDDSVKRSDNSNFLGLYGGSGYNSGATMILIGESRSSSPGTAIIRYGGTPGTGDLDAYFKLQYRHDDNTLDDTLIVDKNGNISFFGGATFRDDCPQLRIEQDSSNGWDFCADDSTTNFVLKDDGSERFRISGDGYYFFKNSDEEKSWTFQAINDDTNGNSAVVFMGEGDGYTYGAMLGYHGGSSGATDMFGTTQTNVADNEFFIGRNSNSAVTIPELVIKRDAGGVYNPQDNAGFYTGAGNDLRIYHNGYHSFINNAVGNLEINANSNLVIDTTGSVYMRDQDDSDATLFQLNTGSRHLTVGSTDDNVFSNFVGNVQIGDSSNPQGHLLTFYTTADGFIHSYQDGWNYISFYTTGASRTAYIGTDDGNNIIIGSDLDNSGTGLIYARGNIRPYTNDYFDLGSTSRYWRYIYADKVIYSRADSQGFYTGASDDLRIYHDGTDSYVRTYTGNLRLVNSVNSGNIIIDATYGGTTGYVWLKASSDIFNDLGGYFYIRDEDDSNAVLFKLDTTARRLDIGNEDDEITMYVHGDTYYDGDIIIDDDTEFLGLRLQGSWVSWYNSDAYQDWVAFNPPDSYEYTTDGSTWVTATDEDDLFLGSQTGSAYIQRSWVAYRMTWDNFDYVQFETLYVYCKTYDNSMKIKAEYSADGSTWTTLFETSTFSNWPGSVAYKKYFHTSTNNHLRLTFTPTWNSESSYGIYLHNIRWFGSYPLDRTSQKLITWDSDKNIFTKGYIKSDFGFVANGYAKGGNSFSESNNDIYIETGTTARKIYLRPNGHGSNTGYAYFGTSMVHITPDVNIGVDVTPLGNLHIKGSSYGPKLVLDDSSSNNKVPIEFRSAGTLRWEFGQRPSSGNYDLRLYRHDTDYHSVINFDYSNGYIGIGNDGPETLLEVGNGASSVPNWMKVISSSADSTASGVGAFAGSVALYLYNDGSTIKLDAYDYGTSTAKDIQLGGNGGHIITKYDLYVEGKDFWLGSKSSPTSRITDSASASYTRFDPQNNMLILYDGSNSQTFRVYQDGSHYLELVGGNTNNYIRTAGSGSILNIGSTSYATKIYGSAITISGATTVANSLTLSSSNHLKLEDGSTAKFEGYASSLGSTAIYLGTTTDTDIVFYRNSGSKLKLTNTEMRPISSKSYNLGSSSYAWDYVYSDDFVNVASDTASIYVDPSTALKSWDNYKASSEDSLTEGYKKPDYNSFPAETVREFKIKVYTDENGEEVREEVPDTYIGKAGEKIEIHHERSLLKTQDYLIATVKGLIEENKALKNKVANLETRLSILEKKVG